MTAFSFHSIELLYLAFRARDAARVDARRPNALTVDTLTAIVMASAALEAFVNELVLYVRLCQQAESSMRETVTVPMASMADCLEAIEDDHGSVVLKYQVAALTLRGSTFPKGEAPFQDFAELVRLRNEVLHLKPAMPGRSHRGEKIVTALSKKGLTVPETEGYALPWLNKLEDPKVAGWACGSAHTMMLAVLALSPDSNAPDEGYLREPFESIKRGLRSSERFPP